MIETVDLSSSDAAAGLEAALSSIGFVQLVGHGLDSDVRKQLRGAADEFFELDHSVKSGFVHDDPAANRGYRARGSEALSYSLGEESPPDLFESFNASPAPKVEHPLMQATPWPDEVVPGFSTAVEDAFADLSKLAARLDQMVGDILGIDWLASRSGDGPDALVNINYRPDPDGNEAVVAGQQRMGAHTDYTSFTLLDAEPVAGLQIVSPSGDWVDITPDAEGVLMNVGDMLAMMTNNAWPSTLHRVVPMAAGAAPFRRSVVLFHYPNLDVEFGPLDNFVTDENPAQYEPVTVEDHLLGKLVAPKVREVATGADTTAGRTTS